MNSINLRRCIPGDEGRLALVGAASFLETFAGVLAGDAIVQHCVRQHAMEKYSGWLGDGHSALWLAEDGEGAAPVGYLLLAKPDLPLTDLGPHDLELKRIYLLGRYQGGGVGGRLLQTAVDHARAVGATRLLLGVYAGNERAQAFYRKAGFVPVGRRSFNVGGTLYDDLILGRALGS